MAVQTLWEWRRQPEFQARVATLRAGIESEIFDRGIAIRANRVKALNDRWTRMRKLIEARAADPEMQDVPGGSTGLLTKNVKGVGGGDDFEVVPIYAADTALLKELRDHERQAAIELEQWEPSKVKKDRALTRIKVREHKALMDRFDALEKLIKADGPDEPGAEDGNDDDAESDD